MKIKNLLNILVVTMMKVKSKVSYSTSENMSHVKYTKRRREKNRHFYKYLYIMFKSLVSNL